MQPHPKTYCGDLADPPAALAPLCLRDNWVIWKWQRSSSGNRWTKPPFCADNPSQHAANNNRKTWGTHHAPQSRPFWLVRRMALVSCSLAPTSALSTLMVVETQILQKLTAGPKRSWMPHRTPTTKQQFQARAYASSELLKEPPSISGLPSTADLMQPSRSIVRRRVISPSP